MGTEYPNESYLVVRRELLDTGFSSVFYFFPDKTYIAHASPRPLSWTCKLNQGSDNSHGLFHCSLTD